MNTDWVEVAHDPQAAAAELIGQTVRVIVLPEERVVDANKTMNEVK